MNIFHKSTNAINIMYLRITKYASVFHLSNEFSLLIYLQLILKKTTIHFYMTFVALRVVDENL